MAGGIGSFDPGGIGGAITGVGGFIGGEEAAAGYGAEATAYGEAADVAEQNVGLEQEATNLQQYQEERKLRSTMGSEAADVAAGNFGEGGSGLYLARSSAQQGYLTQAMTKLQGQIEENSYLEQANAATGEEGMAKAESASAQTKGITDLIGGVAGLFGL